MQALKDFNDIMQRHPKLNIEKANKYFKKCYR